MARDSAATVIDLAAYRRRRQAETTPAPTAPQPRLVWVPTTWGYWIPVWAMTS